MGQSYIFLSQVKQNKLAKDWARYRIFDVSTNKYKQSLSAKCNMPMLHTLAQVK